MEARGRSAAWRQAWPAAPFLILAGAVLSLGADTAFASYLVSSALFVTLAVTALAGRARAGVTALALAGVLCVWLVYGAIKGWLASGGPEYAALAGAGAAFLLGRAAGDRSDRATTAWVSLLAAFGAVGALAFLDHVIDPGGLLGQDKPYHHNRLSTPFLSANTAATFFGFAAVLALGEILRAARRRHTGELGGGRAGRARALVLPVLVFIVTATCVTLTASRAGILLAALAMAALLIWNAALSPVGRARWRSAILGAGMSMIVALSMYAISGEAADQRFAFTGADADGRMILYQTYGEAVRFAPLTGHGPGGFEFVNALAADVETAPRLMLQGAAHNVALQWLLQGGVVGLTVMAAILAGIGRTLLSAVAPRRRASARVRAILVASGFVMAHAMFDYALEIPGFMWVFAWTLGLGAGMAARQGPVRPGLVMRAGLAIAGLGAGIAAALLAVEAFRAEALLSADDTTRRAWLAEGAPEDCSLRRCETFADMALSMGDDGLAPARAALERAVRLEPRDGEIWARLAYVRWMTGARITDVNAALAQSFLVMPHAREEFRVWRLEFTGGLWPLLEDRTQAAAIREARLAPERWRRPWLTQVGQAPPDAAD